MKSGRRLPTALSDNRSHACRNDFLLHGVSHHGIFPRKTETPILKEHLASSMPAESNITFALNYNGLEDFARS